MRKCTILFILVGCISCSPYVSKRIPVGNAMYLADNKAAAINKNLNTVQPVLLCGPDAPCIGQAEQPMIYDQRNYVQKDEEDIPRSQVDDANKPNPSKEKRKISEPLLRKKKSSPKARKITENYDNKAPHGVVLSEDLHKASAAQTTQKSDPASNDDAVSKLGKEGSNFIPLSQTPDKYTDQQREEMYRSKEVKQLEANNKAAELSVPKVIDADVAPEKPNQVPAPLAPVTSSTPPVDSASTAKDTDEILKQLLGNANPVETQNSYSTQDKKEEAVGAQSSNAGAHDVDVDDIKIPPEAITNITD